MLNMKRWLVVGLVVLLGAGAVMAQNYWKDVRSIARDTSGWYHTASLCSAPGTPFDSLLMAYSFAGGSSPPPWFGLKRSQNLGVTFSDSLYVNQGRIATEFGLYHRPIAIAHDSHGIHVVMGAAWSPNIGTIYKCSTDGGNTWSTVLLNTTTYYSVALETDPIGLTAFYSTTVGWIYYRRYTDSTQTWGPEQQIWRADVGDPQAVYVPSTHKIYVVFNFYYGASGCNYPWCYSSTDYGGSWNSEAMAIPGSVSSSLQCLPSIAVSSKDSVYVLYNVQSSTGHGFRVYCSKVGGSSYTQLTNDNTHPWNQQQPRLAIGPGDTLYAAWVDGRTSGYNEIYFDRSGDGGQTWVENPTGNHLVSSSDPQKRYSCFQPDILADGIHQVVVWDSTDNSYYNAIKYRKRSLDTQAPTAPTGLQITQEGPLLWLSWNSVSDAAGYNVYRANGYVWPLQFQKITPQPVLSTLYPDGGVDPTHCYTYYVTAVDAGENESSHSNYAYWYGCLQPPPPSMVATVDAGTPNSSPYTVKRAGYYTWGSTPDSTVDYDPDSLVYRFTGLAPDSLYLLGVGYYEDSLSRGRRQTLNIDGVQAHGAIRLPGTPSKMLFLVPKRTYQDSTITASFVRNQGANAVVAQLWLYQVHFEGGGPQSLGVVDLKGAKAKLYDPAPNPASGSVDISYALAFPGRISLVVYNVAGQRVRTLLDGEQGLGRFTLTWDRKDDSGRSVPGGIYFYRLNAEDAVFTKRITLLR